MSVEPVVVEFSRHHEFVGPRAKRARCKICKRGASWIEHLGFPDQLDNDCGTDPLKWHSQKIMWQQVFGEGIHLSGLPRHLERIQVIVQYTFPERGRRDKDNLFYPLSKFLADTLVRGRYTEVPYEAIDWTPSGSIDGRKLHRRLVIGSSLRREFGGEVIITSRDLKPGKQVTVHDPLGGWIPDDSWERFEIIEMGAVWEPGVAALALQLLPDDTEPPAWPPALNAEPYIQQRIAVL